MGINRNQVNRSGLVGRVPYWREWPSGLMRSSKKWKVPGSKPLGPGPRLGTQPCYEVP